ncbi:unnamed protein product [Plutella xylostella]|uniref:(diamondback moth) hypothetical protein n=1 Tax=Plutella xylostella TaxID=51655 RepID=A0A8S4FL83_PLUXY|nr:unnamed protein product [Plutella xylostella]
MLPWYVELALDAICLVLMLGAASFWAGSGVESRPKYRDEQTMIGGAIWSQLIINIALMLSVMLDASLDQYIAFYFLFCSTVLLLVTGSLLIWQECKAFMIRVREQRMARTRGVVLDQDPLDRCDWVYMSIATLCVVAGLVCAVHVFLIVLV